MLILALDTTSRVASAALCRDGEIIGYGEKDSQMNHSRTILPVVQHLLEQNGLALSGVDVFAAFRTGAARGLTAAGEILPSLIALVTAVAMLRASGALELLCTAFAPAAEQLGLPGELLPMALLRPVSGSGALALFEDILTRFGPDSFIGRTASVLMGSTETTFYTIALYFGATKVRNTRHCLPAALLADLAGICLSAAAVGLFLGR